jgi:hypothetical protein
LNEIVIEKWFNPHVVGIKYLVECAGTLKLAVQQHGNAVAGLFGAG